MDLSLAVWILFKFLSDFWILRHWHHNTMCLAHQILIIASLGPVLSSGRASDDSSSALLPFDKLNGKLSTSSSKEELADNNVHAKRQKKTSKQKSINFYTDDDDEDLLTEDKIIFLQNQLKIVKQQSEHVTKILREHQKKHQEDQSQNITHKPVDFRKNSDLRVAPSKDKLRLRQETLYLQKQLTKMRQESEQLENILEWLKKNKIVEKISDKRAVDTGSASNKKEAYFQRQFRQMSQDHKVVSKPGVEYKPYADSLYKYEEAVEQGLVETLKNNNKNKFATKASTQHVAPQYKQIEADLELIEKQIMEERHQRIKPLTFKKLQKNGFASPESETKTATKQNAESKNKTTDWEYEDGPEVYQSSDELTQQMPKDQSRLKLWKFDDAHAPGHSATDTPFHGVGFATLEDRETMEPLQVPQPTNRVFFGINADQNNHGMLRIPETKREPAVLTTQLWNGRGDSTYFEPFDEDNERQLEINPETTEYAVKNIKFQEDENENEKINFPTTETDTVLTEPPRSFEVKIERPNPPSGEHAAISKENFAKLEQEPRDAEKYFNEQFKKTTATITYHNAPEVRRVVDDKNHRFNPNKVHFQHRLPEAVRPIEKTMVTEPVEPFIPFHMTKGQTKAPWEPVKGRIPYFPPSNRFFNKKKIKDKILDKTIPTKSVLAPPDSPPRKEIETWVDQSRKMKQLMRDNKTDVFYSANSFEFLMYVFNSVNLIIILIRKTFKENLKDIIQYYKAYLKLFTKRVRGMFKMTEMEKIPVEQTQKETDKEEISYSMAI